MRQWRVGSFSMGFTLILFGVVLIIGQVQGGYLALDVTLKWWPAALVLLGLEIVVAGYASGDKAPVIRYDWFGILVTIIFVSVSLVAYAVNVSGILPALNRRMAAAEYPVDFAEERIRLDESITKVVLSVEGQDVELRSAPGSEVVLFGHGRVSASEPDEAMELASRAGAAVSHVGDTIFIHLKPMPPAGGGMSYVRYAESEKWTVLVPPTADLEFSGLGNRTGVILRGLAAEWVVKGDGLLDVNLGPDENARVRVTSRSDVLSPPEGNMAWKPVLLESSETLSADVRPHCVHESLLGDGRFMLDLQVRRPGSVQVNISETK